MKIDLLNLAEVISDDVIIKRAPETYFELNKLRLA